MNISWPVPSNIDQMDLDFYRLSLQLGNNTQSYDLITNASNIITLVNSSSVQVELMINITAVNKCKEMSEPLCTSIDLDSIGKTMIIKSF